MTSSEARSRKIPAKIMVTNVSRKQGGAGRFLDPGSTYGNRILGPDRSMPFDCPGGLLPDFVKGWQEEGLVVIHDALDGTEILGGINGELTPGTVSPFREMSGTRDGDPKKGDFFLDEEEPDLGLAVDAAMPSGPIAGDLRQQHQPRAKVSLGTREEEVIGGELSPIPGDRPRDLDNSQQYTIKAPRASHVGGVVGKR